MYENINYYFFIGFNKNFSKNYKGLIFFQKDSQNFIDHSSLPRVFSLSLNERRRNLVMKNFTNPFGSRSDDDWIKYGSPSRVSVLWSNSDSFLNKPSWINEKQSINSWWYFYHTTLQFHFPTWLFSSWKVHWAEWCNKFKSFKSVDTTMLLESAFIFAWSLFFLWTVENVAMRR